MKKNIVAFILTITMIFSMSTTAFADNKYITNPELQNIYNTNMEMYYKYEAERNQLDDQFEIDNPSANNYVLLRTNWNANVFTNLFGTLYVGYNGPGYYCMKGYTTVYRGLLSYTAIELGPDPKPSVTAAYVKKYNELTALMEQYYDAAQDAVTQSTDEDGVMLRRITDWYVPEVVDPNGHIYLIFQINNYMYASGKANKTNFIWGMIEDGNRNAVPYVVNGNTMIPIRALIEGLGGTVDWDKELNGARATLNGISITMPIGSEYATVNGESVKMTTPAVIANGKTMIPVRFVAENLGYDVEWVSDGQYVVIKDSTEQFITGYNYNIPEGAYQYGYSYNNNRTWSYDVYYDNDYITTVKVQTQLTIESDLSDSHNFKYLTTNSLGVDIYEEIIPREDYNGDSYNRYLKFAYEGTDIVLLVYAEYYVEDYEYDSSGYIGDMHRAYGEIKNDCLDTFFNTIINSISVLWEDHYGNTFVG